MAKPLKKEMENITQEVWKTRLNGDANAVILDVRTSDECATGIQNGAIQLNFLEPTVFSAGLEELEKNKNYYVYCRSGNRSGRACQIMDAQGFTTYNLIGGMMEWDG